MKNNVDQHDNHCDREQNCNDDPDDHTWYSGQAETFEEGDHQPSGYQPDHSQEGRKNITSLGFVWSKRYVSKKDKQFDDDHENNLHFSVSFSEGDEQRLQE